MTKKLDYLDQNYYFVAILATVSLSIAFFGGYIFPTYQTDTYAKWMYSLDAYHNLTFSQARYAEWAYVRLSFLFGSNPPQDQWFHVTLALILNGVVTITLWRKIFKLLDLKQSGLTANVIMMLLIIAVRVNVFESDIFQFDYAAAITFFGDACAMISAILISEKSSFVSYISACGFLILSVSFTQASIFWFVFVSLLLYFLLYLKNPDDFKIWQQLAKRVSVYVTASIWVLFCFRFFVTEKGVRGDVANINIKNTVVSVFNTIKNLFTDCIGTMPKYFYTVLLVIGFSFLCTLLFKGIIARKTKAKLALVITIVLIGTFLSIFPSAIFDTWLAHRTVSGFATILPLLYLMIFSLILKSEVKMLKGYLYAPMLGIIILYILVNWYWTMDIYRGQVITNTVDQQDAAFYYSKIEQYEEQTGQEIKNIAYTEDASFTWSVPEVIAPKSINNRAYDTSWGRREIIRFVSGRQFNIVEFDENIYEEYFKGKDWDLVSEKQIKCIGDTAYIVLY